MLIIVCAIPKGTIRSPWNILLNIPQEVIESTHQHDATNIVNTCRDRAKDSTDAFWQQHVLYLYAMKFFVSCVSRALTFILLRLLGGTNVISIRPQLRTANLVNLGWELQFLVPISGTHIGSGIPIPFLIPILEIPADFFFEIPIS
jgi:hypothetical protein